jgi:mono/diheme cytochrome c family protein
VDVPGPARRPRRYAELPSRYDAATQLAAPITLVLGLAQLLLAWNIIQTMRGKGLNRVETAKSGSPRAIMLGTALLLVASFGGWGVYRAQASTTTAAAPATTTPASVSPAYLAGKQVFETAGCSGCHTLSAAGSTGTVGPDLDQKKPALALVIKFVTSGKLQMPSFKSTLSATQIKDVATFVSTATHAG